MTNLERQLYTNDVEMQVYNAGGQQGLISAGIAANCQSSIGAYQQFPQNVYHYCTCCACLSRTNPGNRELWIERSGSDIQINYGPELRILMADPIKGIDLRDAVQKLKEALLKLDK